MTPASRTILEEAAELAAGRQPFVLATVVWSRRPTSGKPGAKALVRADGSVVGWLGGSCVGPAVVREALEALADGAPRLLCVGPAEELGAPEGGKVMVPNSCASEGAYEVFLEPQLPAPHVALVGGAPMLATLEALARTLGFTVERFDLEAAAGAELETLELPGVGEGSFVVVATMGHYDEAALTAALATPAPYVALVASHKRAAALREALAERGVASEELDRIRSPAGLDLGPIPHEEIAVAVLAEIVQEKARGVGRSTAAAAERPARAVDPICGMEVDPATALHTAEHAGVRYYFCCAGCRERFLADPGAVVAG